MMQEWCIELARRAGGGIGGGGGLGGTGGRGAFGS